MNELIRKKFFSDPDWRQVEKLLMDFLNPMIEMSDIDTTQPAEHIKAEIIGRTLLYKKMTEFLQQSGMVGNPSNYKPVSFK